MVDELV